MKLLALDTATEACSAAIYLDGAMLERYTVAPREHSRLILPMLDELLAEAGLTLPQLDVLAFGRGPGAFTGVRIATSVIQGLAFAADLPVVPVSTLAALAQQAFTEDSMAFWAFTAIDARMGEVYWATYRRDSQDLAELAASERVCPPAAVTAASPESGMAIGSGWDSYAEILQRCLAEQVKQVFPSRYPRAVDIARLGVAGYRQGQAVAAEFALPVYLRDDVAKKAAC